MLQKNIFIYLIFQIGFLVNLTWSLIVFLLNWNYMGAILSNSLVELLSANLEDIETEVHQFLERLYIQVPSLVSIRFAYFDGQVLWFDATCPSFI